MYKTVYAVITAALLTGCASTTITEFDAAGKITKKTETSQSVIGTLTSSTQNKTVIMWEDGWTAYISGSTGTTEDPTPHGKIKIQWQKRNNKLLLKVDAPAGTSYRVESYPECPAEEIVC